MDPNTNLTRQREVLAELRDVGGRIEQAGARGDGADHEEEQQRTLLAELAELCEALDEWLSKGGFLPQAWQHRPDVQARKTDEHTTAVSIAGVDVYVRDASNEVMITVGIDDLPPGKIAWIESFDGTSWERQLP